MAVTVRPLDGVAFGSRIEGVTAERLDDPAVRELLREALDDAGLLLLSGVDADDRLQSRVGAAIGALKDYTKGDTADWGTGDTGMVARMVTGPDNATVVEIAGQRLAGWMPWHWDQCYNTSPNAARVLRCGRGVSSGGTTGFLDGVALYAAMDPPLRDRIEHSAVAYAKNMAYADYRYGRPADLTVVHQQQSADTPAPGEAVRGASHPAVRTLPDGRKVLHVSPWMMTGLAAPDEGDENLAHAIGTEISRLGETLGYHHRWAPTDIVVWDNMRMLHCAGGFDPRETRVMFRTTIQER